MSDAGMRLAYARREAGITAKELGDRVGIGESTVRAHEYGQNGIRPQMAAKYASALKVTPEWLLYGDEREAERPASTDRPANDIVMVPVVGEVRAGAWLEIPDEPTIEGYVPYPVAGYERAKLFALKVVGRSMDHYYPDGTTVIVVPAAQAGVREGDHVVVRRRRGVAVETTLKEVLIDGEGIALWPRSNDAQFQDPIRVERARDADEGPEIIGIVIGFFQKRPPRSGVLIDM